MYFDITRKVIGAAMQVHRTLGPGFPERIYQRALAIELTISDLIFEREKEIETWYRDQRIGTRRADFFVENCIIVEIKALSQLENGHLAQAMNYLEISRMKIGLLINFGAKSLEYKRVHNNLLIKKEGDLNESLF